MFASLEEAIRLHRQAIANRMLICAFPAYLIADDSAQLQSPLRMQPFKQLQQENILVTAQPKSTALEASVSS